VHRSGATKKFNFTKRAIEALPAPAVGTRQNVFDLNMSGLGLVVHPSGQRSFFHLKFVRDRPQRTTIGKFPDLTINQARGKASELNAALAKWKLGNFSGDDPFQKQGDLTLDTLVTEYIAKRVRGHAAHPDRAAKEIEWQVKTYLSRWRNRRIRFIQKKDVLALHGELGRERGNATANRVVQLLRRLFYWAQKSELWKGENPATRIPFFHEDPRTRYVQAGELPRFFTALAKEKNVDLRDFVNLAMWTGARRGDIFSMRWENLSLPDNKWEIPKPKSRKPYVIALTPEAVDILRERERNRVGDSPFVFPSRGRTGHIVDLKTGWAKLIGRAGLTNLRQHDLRRTLGSWQAQTGTSLQIIGESLGHRSLAATKIYSQLQLEPVRESVMRATRAMIAAANPETPETKPTRSKPKRRNAVRV
jgi:integrase